MAVSSGWVATDDWQIILDWSVKYTSGNTAQIVTCAYVNNQYARGSGSYNFVTTVNGSSRSQSISPVSGVGTRSCGNLYWDVPRGTSDHIVGISLRCTIPTASVASYRNGTSCSASVGISATVHNTFTYNANGGTVNGGSTWSNTKWYGSHYYIPTLTMARDGYDFLGWAESASATAPTKHAGDEETRDQALTFYAVWKRRYIPPAIGKLTATRSDSAGTPMDEGTYATVGCEWSVDTTLNASNTVSSVTVAARKRGDTAWGSEVALTAGGTTSGTATGVVGTFDVGYAYDLRVTVTDPGGTATQTTVVTPTFFTMDVLKGGRGIAFGKAATQEGIDFGMRLLRDGQTYLPPHVETLFVSQAGTIAPNVRISKDVSEFDAIRVYLTKKDGKDWNVVSSEAPVTTRDGKTGVFGTVTIFYSANSSTNQLISFAWAFQSGRTYMDHSPANYINFTSNGNFSTGHEDTNENGKLVVFRVLGIKYM